MKGWEKKGKRNGKGIEGEENYERDGREGKGKWEGDKSRGKL